MKLSREYWISQKWGKLRLDPNAKLPDEWGAKSNKKYAFLCECGKSASIAFYNLSRCESCGKCSEMSKSYWISQKWGKLRLDPSQELPDEWASQSNKKFWFLCECGRRSHVSMQGVTQRNQSCGKCSEMSKSYWISQKWGKLRLDPSQELPDEWGSGSHHKFRFICDCGKSRGVTFKSVFSRTTSSCTTCNYLPKSYWLNQKWGKLQLDPNQPLVDEWGRGSQHKLIFHCDCGRSGYSSFTSVAKGDSASCGHCYDLPKSYWLSQRWGNLQLDPDQPLPEGWGTGLETRFTLLCKCGNKVTPMFYNITNGHTTSCGCLKVGENEFSIESEVRRFVASLAPDTYPESYLIEGTKREYDIYVPSKKLAVEYHGLRWHSEELCRNQDVKKDYAKYLLACSRGDRLIQIYGDEWSDDDKQQVIRNQISEILAPGKKTRIIPKFEVVTGKTPLEARTFLDQNHYLKADGGCVTVTARHHGVVVGVWVFQRRSDDVVLWHRACWNHQYKSWNPHQKALEMAKPLLKEMGFKKILTFSDNRFHTGNLYEKLGFEFETDLKPDYGYTNSQKRKAKESFRVKAGVDEVRTAAAQGWFRIWDSGKKRYSLSLEKSNE